eukprot:TRINITY_DN850_c0_g1_i1.p1 TRINITY_DN850_c0_g1~~TRINITY_DN850_c0_g1_i1.p1  ORF type:complete len:231 (-),score=112.74 TRINITY_DN850_c0_g1_i1:53-658(-)
MLKKLQSYLLSLRGARIVGKDTFGNIYYIEGEPIRRYVQYYADEDPTQLPVQWQSWLNRWRDIPPTEDEIARDTLQSSAIQHKVKILELEDKKNKYQNSNTPIPTTPSLAAIIAQLRPNEMSKFKQLQKDMQTLEEENNRLEREVQKQQNEERKEYERWKLEQKLNSKENENKENEEDDEDEDEDEENENRGDENNGKKLA